MLKRRTIGVHGWEPAPSLHRLRLCKAARPRGGRPRAKSENAGFSDSEGCTDRDRGGAEGGGREGALVGIGADAAASSNHRELGHYRCDAAGRASVEVTLPGRLAVAQPDMSERRLDPGLKLLYRAQSAATSGSRAAERRAVSQGKAAEIVERLRAPADARTPPPSRLLLHDAVSAESIIPSDTV